MKDYVVLSPFLDQSMTIRNLLKRHGRCVYAGIIEDLGEKPPRKLKNYDGVVSLGKDNVANILEKFTVVPTGSRSTEWFFSIVQEYEVGQVKFQASNLQAYDKLYMLDLANSLGIPVPKTYQNISDIETFPVFFKPSREHSFGDKKGIAYSIPDIPHECRENYVFQEYIEGRETYGVAFIAEHGNIIVHQSHKELLSYPVIGGSAAIIEKFEDDRILCYTKKILEKIKYTGWGLAEYKYCKRRKDFVFMEVNAKFWASCEFTFRVNPDFGRLLFGVECDSLKSSGMIFTDRLVRNGLNEIPKNWKYFRTYEKIHHTNPIISYGKRIASRLLKTFRKHM